MHYRNFSSLLMLNFQLAALLQKWLPRTTYATCIFRQLLPDVYEAVYLFIFYYKATL